VIGWLQKNSNPFSATQVPIQWKTDPDEREYLTHGYALGFFLASYDGKKNINLLIKVKV